MNEPQQRSRAGVLPIAVSAAALLLIGLFAYLGYSLLRPPPEVDVDWVRPARLVASASDSRPIEQLSDGYASSDACRSCHPGQHASWHGSYHRKMTQLATPETVVGDFNSRVVEIEGQRFHLKRKGDEFWVEMVDPDAHVNARPDEFPIEFPIVMTTGSHHMQVYWYPTGTARTLGQLPIVYLIPEQKWTLRKSVFLEPPAMAGSETGRWNTTCVNCHTTFGQRRPLDEERGEAQTKRLDTRAAEFGIACEACHGPGQRHIEFRANEAAAGEGAGEDPIVNPRTLPHDRSAQVCGQCHAVTGPLSVEEKNREDQQGPAFRPGNDLNQSRIVFRDDPETIQKLLKVYTPQAIQSGRPKTVWSDGMVRVSGREYNGLLESACHTRGELSCVTCHQLHRADDDSRSMRQWANDQLKTASLGDGGCLSCHQAASYQAESHTHHPADSAGSSCYNCHMPHTTYGLVKAIRSHQIDSPNAAVSHKTGRPNACNLCHLDETADWTSQHLNEWYGIEEPLVIELDIVAESARMALSGDAGQRALWAWSMGWPPAVEASGRDWTVPFLATLLEDPYDAVRLIAYRSLRKHPAFADFQYDYVAPPASRKAAAEEAMSRWRRLGLNASSPGLQTLILEDGTIDREQFDRLLEKRNDRPVQLAE